MSDYPAISAILLEIRLAADLIGSLARWADRAVVWTLLRADRGWGDGYAVTGRLL